MSTTIIPLNALRNFDVPSVLGENGDNEVTVEYTLDADLGNSWTIIAPAGPAVTGFGIDLINLRENQVINLIIQCSASTVAYTINWGNGGSNIYRWNGGSPPPPTNSTNAYDVYTFIKINGAIYSGATLAMS